MRGLHGLRHIAKLADDSVTSAKIAADTITAADIAADAVGSSELADNSVDNAALQDDAVTSAKIADDTVTSADILDGTIAIGDITQSVWSGSVHAAGTLAARPAAAASNNGFLYFATDVSGGTLYRSERHHLGEGRRPVTTQGSDLADGAITTSKLADDAVTRPRSPTAR